MTGGFSDGGGAGRGGGDLESLLAELERLGAPDGRPRRIEVLHRALEASRAETGPVDDPELRDRLRWTLLLELGRALLEEADAGRREAAERAFEAIREAVEASERLPGLRGPTLVWLARAALERPGGRRADNVERAIEALGEARAEGEVSPEDTADIDRLLAIAYLDRLAGDGDDNLERALEHAERAAEGLDPERDPLAWASARYLSGEACRLRSKGDRMENLTRAVESFDGAAEVKRRHAGPAEVAEVEAALLETRRELGEVAQDRIFAELDPEVVEASRQPPEARDPEAAERLRRIEAAARAIRDHVPAELLDELTLGAVRLSEVDFRPLREPGRGPGEPLTGGSPDPPPPRTGMPSRGGGRRPEADREEAAEETPIPPPSRRAVAHAAARRAAAAIDRALRDFGRARDAAETGRRPPRWVGSGFAELGTPAEPLAAGRPLAPSTRYLYWFEIGDRPAAGAIEPAPVRLQDDVETGAELDVVLFGFEGGLEIEPGADAGRLRLTRAGAEVVRAPGAGEAGGGGRGVSAEPGAGRLLFEVRTPSGSGPARLRCNLYHRGLLLQSRLVTAWVAEAPPEGEQALAAELDFNLSASLDPATLAAHGGVDLALMINDDGDGIHGLRFYGGERGEEGEEFKLENRVPEGELEDLMTMARGALRLASWGSEAEWGEPEEGTPAPSPQDYRYTDPPAGALRDDLVRLAIRGYRFYTAAIGDLAGDGLAGRALGERLRAPGRVQISERRSEDRRPAMLPAGLFYDFAGFDTNLDFDDDYRLCPDFERALAAGEDLAETPCFQGRCPVRDDPELVEHTVCPSGFWGFRHALGLPASVSASGDAPPAIAYHDAPDLTVAVSLDPSFRLREDHEATLQGLRPHLGWFRGASRREALRLLRASRSHLVYFYCHGGLAGTLPYLLVGPPGEAGITPDNLFTVQWERPRPLVFINGCHTAALSPNHAIRFVDALVKTSRAAGVIGTEVTVFEPLARDFAEACLRRFLVDEMPIGEAVRLARLDLLARGNPLGLVYVPYVLPGLHLEAA